ncbi:hypothetical protein [Mesorhizobium sp. Root552]|nr:hypothetical protein [Mesorhizobium sp. Root552]
MAVADDIETIKRQEAKLVFDALCEYLGHDRDKLTLPAQKSN